MTWILGEGWSDVDGKGEAKGSVLRASFDFSALDSADWTGEASVSLTADGGTKGGTAITWTLTNMGAASVFGPNGTTGIAITAAASTVWSHAADTAPYMWVDPNDIWGASIPLMSVLEVRLFLAGEAPDTDSQIVGIVWEEAVPGFGTLLTNATSAGVTTRLVTSATTNAHTAAAPNVLISTWNSDTVASAFRTDGASPPAVSSSTNTYQGQCGQNRTVTTSANPVVDLNAAGAELRLMSAQEAAAATFTPILTKAEFWEVVF